MGYKFWCEGCGHNYYTVNSGTWNKRGTVTVYPSYGYCGSCHGGSASSWSYSGNVVKLECRGCSNKCGIVTWSDWRRGGGETCGYCNGCVDDYKREKARREAEEREKARKQREDDARKKENYCPASYSFSSPNWANVQHSIDSHNYLWSNCKIYCNSSKNHCIYHKDKFDSSSNSYSSYNFDSGNKIHQEILAILSKSKCPKCEAEQQAAVQAKEKQQKAKIKITEIGGKLDNLSLPSHAEKLSESDKPPINISRFDELMGDSTAALQDLVNVKEEAYTIPNETNDILQSLAEKNTYSDEEELDGDIGRIEDQQTKIVEKKKKFVAIINDTKKK
eukprot:33108_1